MTSTLPMFSAGSLDTAAVEAMVSMVGTYTLDALRDSELRAQHKKQCTERLKMNNGAQGAYSDQAILANLEWGIDALEEAISTSQDETKVARLDHAEKMLQVCALLDSRVATAGVPNCYLSAWAHVNLAFVWEVRNNDLKATNHMLEMFLADPLYSRLDFAPALWEHLFLPYLSNIVNWYTKQRTSITVSGTLRTLSENREMSLDISRDFTSNSANVLHLSADQTTQLQGLEKLYQDSLDENTRQYARYYKDCLNYDPANKQGIPLMPIAEPPDAESWVPLADLPTDEVLKSSTWITMPVIEPILLGLVTSSSKSLPNHYLALSRPQEFNDFDNPEFAELAEPRTIAAQDRDGDPDSPHSNFRRPGGEHQGQEATSTSNLQSESVEHMSIETASTDQNTPSGLRLLRSTAVRHSDLEDSLSRLSSLSAAKPSLHSSGEIGSAPICGEIGSVSSSVPEIKSALNSEKIRSVLDFRLETVSVPTSGETKSAPNSGETRPVPNSGEIMIPNSGEIVSVSNAGDLIPLPTAGAIRTDSGLETSLADLLQIKLPPRRSTSPRQQPGTLDSPAAGSPTSVDRELSDLGDNSSSLRMSHDGPRGWTGRRASRLNHSSSSGYSNSQSGNRKLDSRLADSQRYEEFDWNLSRRNVTHQHSEGSNENSESAESPEEPPVQSTFSWPWISTDPPEAVDSSRKEYSLRESTTHPEEADSSNDFSDSEASGSPQIQDLKLHPRKNSFRNSGSAVRATGQPSTTRTRFLSKHGNSHSRSRSAGNSRRYKKGDDGLAIVTHSGPLLGTPSERYQLDNDDEPITGRSGPLLGRASRKYHNGDEEPKLIRIESGDSGSAARDHGRSRRHRRSESLGSMRNSTMDIQLTRPPKDFVCPITSQLFDDPVTLETGQTFERMAIQEWLNRGHETCPITRQMLRQNRLPKTNYVLKRLVNAWKEQYPKLAKEFGSSPLSSNAAATDKPSSEVTEMFVSSSPYKDSPGSGRTSGRLSRRMLTNNNFNDISRPDSPVDVDDLIVDLKPAMSYLCTSENLAECESVVLEISKLILQAGGDQRLLSVLNRTDAIAGMMELLFNSQEARVLSATLFLLSVVIATDDTARQAVVSADPEAGCFVGLLRNGLTSAASVLYQLKLPKEQLVALDLLPLLVAVIKETEENQGDDVWNEQQGIHFVMMRPKSAAIMLLDQILRGGDETTFAQNAEALLALQAVPVLVSSLDQTKDVGVRPSVISLLLCCIRSDGRIRNRISKKANLAAVVDLLHCGNSRDSTIAITFLTALVHLSRRALCRDVLKKLKSEGSLSSMRVLLVYLQIAPLEHRPVAASLLLQLDLLEEPRKGSIYREEAVDCLVEALSSTDWPCPAKAANTLICLGGRFSYTGKPMMKAWLLKKAGIDKYFLSNNKQDSNDNDSTYDQEEEERAAKAWERKVAGALVGHDFGKLIEALGQGIQTKNPDVSQPCMVVATWLTHMLPTLPDTGIRQTARNCLLDHFVGVLQTSKDFQQRVLAALAIQSFISDPEGVQELFSYWKNISGPLQQLKKLTWTAKEILQAVITRGDANSPDLWVHAEQGQLDVTANGEVRALVKSKTHMFSGHSDGTVKIWETKKRFPVLLQEVKEHTKSVMALTVLPNSNQIYSGSLDKTIRVWTLGAEDIRCVKVFNLKEAVVGLLVNGPMACIIPQGAGLKVQYEETTTKILNSNKHVQTLAISDGKIFCGCADNSLQELDPISESINTIQQGVRTLIGKKPIYATEVFQDHLYVAGAPVEGVAGKVWKLSNHSLIGTMCTTSEVRSMAISEDFIYLGSSSGVIEVWLRERLLRVSALNTGSKVICLMLDGDTLYSGHEDGKIRIWTQI